MLDPKYLSQLTAVSMIRCDCNKLRDRKANLTMAFEFPPWRLIFVSPAFDAGALDAKQYEQMDQLLGKWHGKVWKWHTESRTHSGWLNPVSPAGPLGSSYQAGAFSTFHSLPLNPFRRLHYMSTVAHCLHQRLCVSACVQYVCVCVHVLWIWIRISVVTIKRCLQEQQHHFSVYSAHPVH